MQTTIQELDRRYTVCRLSADAPVPTWATEGPFISITRTRDELSLIIEDAFAIGDVQKQTGFIGFKVMGPLAFDVVGVLASLATPLAKADIPILAIGTYDTDYLFIHESHRHAAIDALRRAGHTVNLVARSFP